MTLPANIKTLQDLTADKGGASTELNKRLLPAHPVSFVVCKDITIRSHMETTDIKSAGAEMEKFACWSVRSSEHDKASDKIYSFAQKSDGCVIRIPGPSDESTEIPEELPDGFLLSDDYNSSFPVQPATSHAVNLNAANFVAPAPEAKVRV